MRFIVLDSGPLALITQRKGVTAADECREWLAAHLIRGVRAVVPEIADYEVRRELHRAGKITSLSRLDGFIAAVPDRYLPISTLAMRLAAQLWADLRNKGLPTADVLTSPSLRRPGRGNWF